MKSTLQSAISRFGLAAKAKLDNPAATGEPEDQLRAPFEQLLADLATLAGHADGTVVAVGESERFRGELDTPGLRIPLTADAALFAEAAELGRRVVWLHTFGERMHDNTRGRPHRPPRLPAARQPRVPEPGTIPGDAGSIPDRIEPDAPTRRLHVGSGWVEPVPPEVWRYEVSGKQVLTQWFSYSRKTRDRPVIGDRRAPSPLGDIQPDGWPAAYTTDLLNVLNVLGLLVELEPEQARLPDRICTGPLIARTELEGAGVLASRGASPMAPVDSGPQPDMFGR